ncbi:MAG: hypothetical protein CL607_07635 [Anaerolineaceae bacterium]|nr:hypothetical protein [Anaerolineaceae bacterium]
MKQTIPSSILAINNLATDEKVGIYARLIPEWIFDEFGIDRASFCKDGQRVIDFQCKAHSRSVEITVKRAASDQDPMLYLNMADTLYQQLHVLLVVFNDMDSKRYNIDVDQAGNPTFLGTSSRNITEEIAAMEAGLGPGQIRKGLRAFKNAVPIFEDFIIGMGHDLFLIEPLAYHNAILFEKYGFNYTQGKQEMQKIHDEFQPGGRLHDALNNDNPFRHQEAWKTVRGRSWAIHDGILGYKFSGAQMYKRVGHHADVNTFPDAIW